MGTQGIRIPYAISIKLSDICSEVVNDKSLYWSILFVDGTPQPGEGKFLTDYNNQVNKSKNGLRTSLEELLKLSSKFYQIFEMIVLASKDPDLLLRYKNEQEMYNTCDIVIDLIDCACWEVYAKDAGLIARLASKFKQVEYLTPDFEE